MLGLLLLLTLGAEPGAMEAERAACLTELREILPPSPAWETWLEESGELPPDFAALPGYAPLPDPLAYDEQ